MAAATGPLRTSGTRVVYWALRASHPLPLRIAGNPSHHRCFKSEPWRSRAPAGPTSSPPTTDATPAEAAEQGLRIIRERSEHLEQGDAVEALRLLLHAASVDSTGRDVFFALGELHYNWGHLLEFGKKAELGAEGAAKAVVAEIKELRKQAMRQRRLAPASGGSKAAREATRKREGGTGTGGEGAALGGASGDDASAGDGMEAFLVEVDHPEAWEWYLKAATCGDTRAMMRLGDIAMESAAKTAINMQHAEEWFRKAAEGEPPQPNALFQIARIHHEGIGVPCDPARSRKLYEEAREAGSLPAAYFLGHAFHFGHEELGIEADGARALHLLRHASKKGHAEATFYLAQAYRSGSPELGVAQDLRAFGELVQKAAAAGSADALFALGGAFFHGDDGFARDPRAAFRCYASAADDGGHADASYCLGVMNYAMGDMQEAFRRYQTAAEGGNMLAWRNLASMYALGEGVERSEQMAKNILQTFGERIRQQEKEENGETEEGDEENEEKK